MKCHSAAIRLVTIKNMIVSVDRNTEKTNYVQVLTRLSKDRELYVLYNEF